MKNGILFDLKTPGNRIIVDQDKEAEDLGDWQKKNINIIERIICSQEDLIEPKLKEAIQKVKQTDSILVIPSFSIIPKTIENLALLQKNEIDFHFADFEELSSLSLPIIIKFLRYWGQEKSEKIKDALSRKKAAGAKLGNPKIDSPYVIEKAKKKRTFLAKIDTRNILAMERINLLKTQFNNNRIANILNEEGFKTRRGKNFHAKTVERLIKMTNEIKKEYKRNKAFESNKELDKLSVNLRGQDGIKDNKKRGITRAKKGLPIEKFPDLKNFEKVIEINFKERSNPINLDLTLADNKAHPVFTQNYELKPKDNNISIDIDKNNISPGLYYLRIVADNFKIFFKPIKIKADSFNNLISSDKPG